MVEPGDTALAAVRLVEDGSQAYQPAKLNGAARTVSPASRQC